MHGNRWNLCLSKEFDGCVSQHAIGLGPILVRCKHVVLHSPILVGTGGEMQDGSSLDCLFEFKSLFALIKDQYFGF